MSGPAPRLYRLALRAYPRRFRERWGAEMQDTFRAHLAAARNRRARLLVWVRGLRDVGLGALRERQGRGPTSGPGRTPREGGGEGMRTLLNDARYAVRSLGRRPLLTLSAGLTLAIGIGANTAIFSIVHGLLIRPLPYPDEDRLVVLWSAHAERGWSGTDVNAADAWDWRTRSGVFDDLAVYQDRGVVLTGGERPELLSGIVTTPNLLSLLDVEPALGRDLGPQDGRVGAPGAAVLAHGFWQRRFGGDPDVLGRELVLDEETVTVVGILDRDFRFLDGQADVFVAWRADPAAEPRGSHGREALARLRDGVTVGEAARAVNEVARALQREHPATNEGWTAEVVGVRADVLGDTAARASVILSVAVGFLLLMACVNVASLLLARGAGRQSEMAVRTALGAGRGRLVRLLLLESTALAAVGGLLGMGVAEAGRRFIVAGLPDNLPPVFRFDIDPMVLGFAIAVTAGSALVFGLLPALRTAAPAGELRSGRRVHAVGRLTGGLVIAQTALAAVLLVAGGVLTRSVAAMQGQDFGWDPEGVLYLRVTPPESRYPEGADLTELGRRLDEAVGAVSGVVAVGTIQSAPLQGSNWSTTIRAPGSGPDAGRDLPARVGYVSPGYFDALGVELRGGRAVTAADGPDAPRVAVVNETFARRYLAGTDPVGTTFEDDEGAVQVIGVVEDHIERSIDRPVEPALYRPAAQNPVRTRTMAVRVAGDATAAVSAVREAVWSVDGDLPVWDVRTLDDVVVMRVGGFRIIAQLMGAFALVSLFLGAVGTYGVTAQSVGRRTHEIGVRMALGADRRGVMRMVVLQGARRAAIGLLLGGALALAMSGGLEGLAVGVDPRDPTLYAAVLAVLALVSLLASWLPARRASGVDPVRALSAE